MQPLHAPGPVSYPGHEMMALLGEWREPWTFPWRTPAANQHFLAFSADRRLALVKASPSMVQLFDLQEHRDFASIDATEWQATE